MRVLQHVDVPPATERLVPHGGGQRPVPRRAGGALRPGRRGAVEGAWRETHCIPTLRSPSGAHCKPPPGWLLVWRVGSGRQRQRQHVGRPMALRVMVPRRIRHCRICTEQPPRTVHRCSSVARTERNSSKRARALPLAELLVQPAMPKSVLWQCGVVVGAVADGNQVAPGEAGGRGGCQRRS
jgi:hypothetical protein